MHNVFRLDFNGSSSEHNRTPQGFLRVKARLTRTGVFKYDDRREYRSEEEVFHSDSLASLAGAPVTDLHPSEKGGEQFLTLANAKTHMVGITESVERDGAYLKGSLLIFHEDTIKAIERGERKEISLGYKCIVEPASGLVNGEAFDAIQKNIVINHVALGPQGWGRAGPDCAIHTDSQTQNNKEGTMVETIHLDGMDIALTAESIKALFAEKRRQLQEVRGRLDAVGQELERERGAREALEDPKTLESKLQARLKLIEKCKSILGDEYSFDGKNDSELKLAGLKHVYPELDIAEKDPAYLDGMFEAICAMQSNRNDSLSSTRKAINQQHQSNLTNNDAYESWVQRSATLWQKPLSATRGI